MPLERVGVRNEYALGAPELYRDVNKEDPKEVLEGVTVAGLVGVLRQLGDLAEFAGEVFHGLQEEVTIMSSRSRKLMSRVQQIEAALSPLEKAVLAQKSHLHFAYTAGSNWHPRIRCRQSHFLYGEMPQFIMESYEECRDLPNLQLLDRFDPAGPGSCLRRYSDPTFFKRASAASGEISAKKISKDKKNRRIKKRRTWPRNGDMSRDESFSCNSGRMQFTQLNIGVHPSPSQTATTLRSELDEQLNLGLRNGSSYADGDSRPSFSVQPEEQEFRESISSPVMRRNSDFLDYDFLREKTTDTYDNIQINLPHVRPASSSSLTWDEKDETIDPITRESDADPGIILENDSDVKAKGYNALDFETVEEMDVQPLAVLSLGNSGDHLDDIESEADQFLDALNTIESEGDTDVEWSKKQGMLDLVQDEELQPIRDRFEMTSSKESNIPANSYLTSIADTSSGHLDSAFQESSHEINGSIQAVAVNNEFNSVPLDGKALQLSNTDIMPLTSGNALQTENEFNSAFLIDNVLQSSQPDGMPSSPGSPVKAKDEFNLLSDAEKSVQSSQADALSSASVNLVEAKDELNIFSKIDKILLASETDAISSTPGSIIQARDELHSDKIVASLQPDAMPSTPSSLLQAEDESNSVPIVDKILQSYQTTGVSSPPGDQFPEKEEHNTISFFDKALQSFQTDGISSATGSPQSINSHKNGSINAGKNVEPVSCNLSSDFRDNGSGMQITDGATSSLESRKPTSDTSSVASVSFWTNGGLLGLQPSKPPDFTTLNGIPQDNANKINGKSENLTKSEEINSPNSQGYQETGASLRKPSWKISPADLSIDLSKLSNSLHSNTSSIGSSATSSGSIMPVNSTFQAVRKHQEYSGSSSQMFGLSNRLLPNGSNKKLLPCGGDFEQRNHQNGTRRVISGQKYDLYGESPMASPCSSPPLHHMKMSFQPMDGLETSKLKLKFPDGNINSKSVSDIFPSFQLVPETSIAQNNDDSDSDGDTFYKSSPSVSDDCHSNHSESNSEQWESNESSSGKDHELYDSLCRISLTESVSTSGIGMQNSDPSQMFDHQSLGSTSHSFRKEVRNGVEASPDVPPLPPIQWQGTATPYLNHTEQKCDTIAEDSNHVFRLQHSTSTISQPKPAPAKEDHITMVKLQIDKFNSKNTDGQQKGAGQYKSFDEKGDFLHQIRTKSFNLRPTFIDKPLPQPTEAPAPAHVQVSAILQKANAIRQAVGSDDDGTWSDT